MSKEVAPVVAVMPGLRLLYSARIEFAAPMDLGKGPLGQRRIINIRGGVVSGPRLSGRVLPGGTERQLLRADGSVELAASYTLETKDGVLIQVSSRGLRHGPPEVMARLGAGEAVDPAEYYFRTAPQFETGDFRYAWINGMVAIAVGEQRADAAIITAYEVS